MRRPFARFGWCPFRWVSIETPYDPGTTQEIKEIANVRAWDPQVKVWWIPETLAYQVKASLENRFQFSQQDEVFRKRYGRRTTYAPGDSWQSPTWDFRAEDPFSVLGVQDDAPNCVIRAARWALCYEMDENRMLGGSFEPRLRVEEAYQKICEIRGIEP